MRRDQQPSGLSRAGFTLIELLVACCVVVIVLSLLLPALAGARSSAREAACLSNLRQVGVVFDAYARESRDAYPFSDADTWLLVSPPEDPRSAIRSGQHFDFVRLWPAVMHRVAPWREHYAAWVCAGAKRAAGSPWLSPEGGTGTGPGRGSSYVYSGSFIARPELWSGSPAEPVAQWLKVVRLADVVSPARKVLVFDEEMAHQALRANAERRPMLFADGHAAVHDRTQASEPVANPVTGGTARRLHDTRDGVRGSDY